MRTALRESRRGRREVRVRRRVVQRRRRRDIIRASARRGVGGEVRLRD